LTGLARATLQRNTMTHHFSMFSAALATVADPQGARHPARAKGGLKLLGDLRGTDRESYLVKSGHEEGGRAEIPNCKESRAVCEQQFFDSMPDEFAVIESVEQVINPRLLRRFLKGVQAQGGSVEATFHGTPTKFADNILKEGLLKDMNTTAAYGKGAYVGAHAGVAHQYADPDGKGRRCMCVVLVNIGSEIKKGKMGDEQSEVTAVDRVVNPTQYCFVDETRLLVSHIITYKVTGGQRKRVGGGWYDPFATKLNEAVTKASKDRQQGGVL